MSSRRLLVLGVVVAVVAAGIAVAAWGGDRDATDDVLTPAVTPTASVSPSATQSPTSTPSAQGVPSPWLAPEDLGPGWQLFVVEDDPEEGVVGNGTAFLDRDPAEVVALSVPLGCEQRSRLPLPGSVVEANLSLPEKGTAAVSLRMTFADDSVAAAFGRERWADIRACVDQPDDPYSGAASPVTYAKRVSDLLVASSRTDPYQPAATATWTEFVLVTGEHVGVLAVQAPPNDPAIPSRESVQDVLTPP